MKGFDYKNTHLTHLNCYAFISKNQYFLMQRPQNSPNKLKTNALVDTIKRPEILNKHYILFLWSIESISQDTG
jgi:hypothetical protein